MTMYHSNERAKMKMTSPLISSRVEAKIDHLRPTRSASMPVGTSIRKIVKIMIDSIRLICTSVSPRANSSSARACT